MADPRQNNPTGHLYTVDCLGNLVEGKRVIYNNQPIDVLMRAAADSIKSGEPVWFGSEVRNTLHLFIKTDFFFFTSRLANSLPKPRGSWTRAL